MVDFETDIDCSKMKYPVILVNVSRKTNQIQFPIGLSVIANSLLCHDIKPEVIDLIVTPESERISVFKKRIPDEPAIYGFSMIIGGHHLDETEKYAKLIRAQSPESIIVYGGSLPSSIPELMLERCSCDYVVHGEGETVFPQLVQAINNDRQNYDDITGVFIRKGNEICGTRNGRIRKLDKLSDPNFTLFDMDFYMRYLRETGQSWEIMASRGCCGKCAFCHKFMGDGLSFRNVDAVLDEIEYVIDNFDIPRFYFVDENFPQRKSYFMKFIEKKNKRGLDFTFNVQSRIDAVDRQLCEVGSANGLVCISTGVESASQKTLDLISKHISIEDAERKIAMMREYGIKPAVNFIIGFPWEIEQDYIELLEFIDRNNLQKHVKMAYLTPLPATKIYREVLEKGLIKDEFEYVRNLNNIYWNRHINLTCLPGEILDYYYNLIADIGQKDTVTVKSKDYLDQIRELH